MIYIAVRLLIEHNLGSNITKAELKKLFEFPTSGTYFIFQGTFYDQKDGVAMGSPFGPVPANPFHGLLRNYVAKFISRIWNNFV